MQQTKILQDTGLTFDDILLLPTLATLKREEIDISGYLTPDIKLSVPFVSAPMDRVTTAEMAIALGKLGGVGVIHRNLTISEQVLEVKKVKEAGILTASALGVGKDLGERCKALVDAGVDVIVVDSAHGYSKWVIEATKFIADKYPKTALISGNVATAEGAKALIDAGADGIRVGMGPGSICSTRVVAGVGVPQVSAILSISDTVRRHGVTLVADGGLRYSGDIVKALACGANTIMSGSLFAGTKETPGEVITEGGKKYKSYRGMGSLSSMREGSAQRYGQEYRKGQEKKLVAEGVEGYTPYKGPVEEIVTQLIGGLRSGMYYLGAGSIEALWEKARMIRVTQASLIESHPHDIILK